MREGRRAVGAGRFYYDDGDKYTQGYDLDIKVKYRTKVKKEMHYAQHKSDSVGLTPTKTTKTWKDQ